MFKFYERCVHRQCVQTFNIIISLKVFKQFDTNKLVDCGVHVIVIVLVELRNRSFLDSLLLSSQCFVSFGAQSMLKLTCLCDHLSSKWIVSVANKLTDVLFNIRIRDYKNLSWLFGMDRQICPEGRCSASRGLPSDAEQWSRGTDVSIHTK